MAVVIQNSNESKLIYGADVSGTVFKEISDHIYSRFISKAPVKNSFTSDTTLYNYYGVKNDFNSIFSYLSIVNFDSAMNGTWRAAGFRNNTAALNLPSQALTAMSETPDVTGMGLKDAVYLLESKGLKTVVSGRGRVVNQSIAPHASFKRGEQITLRLN